MGLNMYKTSDSLCCGVRYIVFHETTIMQISSSRTRLHINGWETAPTKRRINQASDYYNLGFQVFQKDFVWYVRFDSGRVIPFKENMTIERGYDA